MWRVLKFETLNFQAWKVLETNHSLEKGMHTLDINIIVNIIVIICIITIHLLCTVFVHVGGEVEMIVLNCIIVL